MIDNTSSKKLGNKMAYRRDIDGLRFIAVMSVLLFHLDLSWIPGGFVGVDVFFVISGFLITRLIRREILNTGKFSFSQFYLRRARRLLPAFFTVLLATVIGALFILPPDAIPRFGKATASASLSVSNFFFWMENGYFDTQAQLKPLLHTWTLAVEEQFYMIWPLLLLFSMRKGITKAPLIVLAVLGVASLLAAEFFMSNSPEMVFYLLPFRLCEFALGAGLVWFMDNRSKSSVLHSGLFLAGLSMILWAVFTFTEETRFPGLSSMVPCIGTVLMIYSGNKTRLSRPLEWKPIVGLGLISYSLYLIHWPVIVLYKYSVVRPLTNMDAIVLAGASIILAVLVYKLIETPLRHKTGVLGRMSGKAVAASFLAVTSSFVVMGFWAQKDNFFDRRGGNEEIIAFREASRVAKGRRKRNLIKSQNREAVKKNPHSIAIIGDSYADDIFDALSRVYKKGGKYEHMIHNGCRPLVGGIYEISKYTSKRGKCIPHVKQAYEKLALRKDIKTVILVTRWEDEALPYLQPSIDALAIMGKRIIIIGPRYRFEMDHSLIANRAKSFSQYETLVDNNIDKKKVDEYYSALQVVQGITLIDIRSYQCPDGKCTNRIPGSDMPIVYDGEHFSSAGSAMIVRQILKDHPNLFVQ